MSLSEIMQLQKNKPFDGMLEDKIGYRKDQAELFQLKKYYSKQYLSILSELFVIKDKKHSRKQSIQYVKADPLILLLAFQAFKQDVYRYVLGCGKNDGFMFEILSKDYKRLAVDLLTTMLKQENSKLIYFLARKGKEPIY